MPSGKLILIFGCMYAGKTNELLKYNDMYTKLGKTIASIKYSNDTRYSSDICTHDHHTLHPTFNISRISPYLSDLEKYDVILIDEVQFFPDAAEIFDYFANQGKIIVASGLTGTFSKTEFPVISTLIPMADEIIVLYAVCEGCQGKASFSKRICRGDSMELIGGKESYLPMCRKCFSK